MRTAKQMLGLGLVLILAACGDSANPNTASSPSPTPAPVNATHGSSSVDAAGQTCLVQGGSIVMRVNGGSTEGYFSASDKGVGLSLRYVFVAGTDPTGKCPGPSRASWSFGNINSAGCEYTGVTTEPSIRLDANNPGQCAIVTTVWYPDGSTEILEMDARATARPGGGVRLEEEDRDTNGPQRTDP